MDRVIHRKDVRASLAACRAVGIGVSNDTMEALSRAVQSDWTTIDRASVAARVAKIDRRLRRMGARTRVGAS